MICAKFDRNWPSGSQNGDFEKGDNVATNLLSLHSPLFEDTLIVFTQGALKTYSNPGP